MRTRLLAVLLLLPLTACGGADGPAAAPAPSPTPSPTPAAAVFDPAAVRGALLTAAEAPSGYTVLGPELGGAQELTFTSLCAGAEGTRPPTVPPAPAVFLQGTAGFDSVVQSVAVLPDEATAVAVLAAVQRHAATCERTVQRRIGAGSRSAVQTTTNAAVVPLVSGQWRGVRQSSSSTFASRSTQRWQTQSVVLRRGNAVLDLEVSGESAPPDLAVVLERALARLDATL